MKLSDIDIDNLSEEDMQKMKDLELEVAQLVAKTVAKYDLPEVIGGLSNLLTLAFAKMSAEFGCDANTTALAFAKFGEELADHIREKFETIQSSRIVPTAPKSSLLH